MVGYDQRITRSGATRRGSRRSNVHSRGDHGALVQGLQNSFAAFSKVAISGGAPLGLDPTNGNGRSWPSFSRSAALNYADRTAITSVFPLLRRDLGISDVGLGAIGSLFLWSYAFSSPMAGVFADRFSRSRLIAISLAAWSLVTAATGLVTDASQLYTLRVLLGLSECLYLPAALGLLADYHGSDTRATALGIHSGGLTAGMVAGGTAAGFFADHFGWGPCFLTLGLVGIMLAITAAMWLRDAPRRGPDDMLTEPLRATISALAATPSYGIILAEAALIALSTWVFANWLPLYFRETYGLSLAAAGFSGTLASTVGATLGVLTGGYLSDRVARGDARRRLLMLSLLYALSAAVPSGIPDWSASRLAWVNYPVAWICTFAWDRQTNYRYCVNFYRLIDEALLSGFSMR